MTLSVGSKQFLLNVQSDLDTIPLDKLQDASQTLVDLCKMTEDPSARIATLLSSKTVVIRPDWIPMNGFNVLREDGSYDGPGLHTAVMEAANRGHVKALEVLFQARPDMDVRILTDTLSLFSADDALDISEQGYPVFEKTNLRFPGNRHSPLCWGLTTRRATFLQPKGATIDDIISLFKKQIIARLGTVKDPETLSMCREAIRPPKSAMTSLLLNMMA
ncbi:MAG TPA: hypothetical protein VGO47_06505 [Chlamydiales bacterium]|jgi:hypothetical protein|nr:hypothetical protein [Chlamydiales bacterium]